MLVEHLHGSAAAVVLNPLENQTHDVDTAPTTHSQNGKNDSFPLLHKITLQFFSQL